MPLDLSDKTILITGAARGIGRALATGMAHAGAQLALLDIDEGPLEATTAEVQAANRAAEIIAVPCDVSDPVQVRSAAAAVVGRFGKIDALINDAVVGPERLGPTFMVDPPKFWALDNDLWRRMFTVNVFGAHLMAKTVTPLMLEAGAGRLVNITTSLDTMYRSGVGAYGATKAALEAHTRVMAQDLDGTGVTANVLIPGGPVNTRMIPAETGVPRDQLIQPAAMVPAAIWLCSDAAKDINGMRFIAARFPTGDTDAESVVQASGAPAAWPQLGAQAIYPDD